MDSPSSSARHTSYGPSKVIQDFLIFNIDSWPKNDSGWWYSPTVVLYEDQFCNKDYSSLWKMFLVKDPYKSDLKDILQLIEILLLLPISAAGCERMISLQNRINSSLRAALKKSSLEGLIRISAENWSLEEFDTLPSVDR